MRMRLFRILENAQPPTPLGRAVDVFLIALISLNVVAAIVETVDGVYAQFEIYFGIFESVSIVVFTVEYLARIWVCVDDPEAQNRAPLRTRLRYMVSPLALIDLIAIAPAYLAFLFAVDLRWLRLFRLLRLFKLTRYWSALNLLYRVLRDEAQIIGAALFLLCIIMVLASGGMFVVEHRAQPEVFSSVPAAMWWTVSTLTTVGYGDVVPVTTLGKILGGFISLIGIGMVAFPAGILAAGFAEQIRRSRRLYRERVDEAMAEGRVSEDTAAALEEARTELGLSEDIASDIVRSEAAKKEDPERCPHCGAVLPSDQV